MHTSSTVKLYEAIQLAIFRTIDACSDLEEPQYQTRPDTSLEQGGLMVIIFARESGMDLLDHLRGVLYEKLLLFFFSGSTPRCRTEGSLDLLCWMPRAISRVSRDEVEGLRSLSYLSMRGEELTV